ncbi:MAG: RlmE family RNA methyltransferase [Kordiimonadaceae bacterium]|jgi:23S rRNA (uridine2552-2'-O)-methyltransferase|nr:RlmE family RNA methyltransferase [Kordiimonadaceae bacterium]MBT6031477.1 RlmE family RNA methyltransferase [Kordiimonadaceae bacterium]
MKKPKLSKTGKERRLDPRGIVRGEKTRVHTARRRKSSSTRWLQRQLNDPYVAASKRDGFRSRAAYKIIELDERFSFLHGVKTVVDLGAAPGGWTQVAAKKCSGNVRIIGIDLLEIAPIADAEFVQMDFTENEAEQKLLDMLDGEKIDLVMSDLAAATTGHQNTDYIRTIGLVELGFDFAKKVLAENGTYVAKVFRGGTDTDLLIDLKKHFNKVRHFKPPASRSSSKETYMIAQGFKGKS